MNLGWPAGQTLSAYSCYVPKSWFGFRLEEWHLTWMDLNKPFKINCLHFSWVHLSSSCSLTTRGQREVFCIFIFHSVSSVSFCSYFLRGTHTTGSDEWSGAELQRSTAPLQWHSTFGFPLSTSVSTVQCFLPLSVKNNPVKRHILEFIGVFEKVERCLWCSTCVCVYNLWQHLKLTLVAVLLRTH